MDRATALHVFAQPGAVRKLDLGATRVDLSTLIGALGSEDFGQHLGDYAHQICGADHCTVYRIGGAALSAVTLGRPDDAGAREHLWRYVYGHYWRKDPLLACALDQLDDDGQVLVRVQGSQIVDRALRADVYPGLVERLLLCGRLRHSVFCISLLRWGESSGFSEEDALRVAGEAAVLTSVVERHAEMSALRRDPADALGAVHEAERCLAETTRLTRREREVCARIVTGLPAPEVARQLAVGEESVKCYRKRAYLRLGVACERELVTHYLRLWSAWHGTGRTDAAPGGPGEMSCLPRSARVDPAIQLG